MSRPPGPPVDVAVWPADFRSAFADATLVAGVENVCCFPPLGPSPSTGWRMVSQAWREAQVPIVEAQCLHPPTPDTLWSVAAAVAAITTARHFDHAFAPLRQLRIAAIARAADALAAWRRTDPAAADACWGDPVIVRLAMPHPVREALRFLLFRAVAQGLCPGHVAWRALTVLGETSETVSGLWAPISEAWRTTAGRRTSVPAPRVQFLEEALAIPVPSDATLRALHVHWRREVIGVLAEHRCSPESQQIATRCLVEPPGTAPLTDEALRVLMVRPDDPLSVLLALAQRLPIPPLDADLRLPVPQAVVQIACDLREASFRYDVLWRALWAQARTSAQRLTLLGPGGLMARGPWWRDPVFVSDAFAALATAPFELVRHWSTSIRSVLNDQIEHVDVGAWLQVAQALDPGFPDYHLAVLTARAITWLFDPTSLLPLLEHPSPTVREAAQMALAVSRPMPSSSPAAIPPLRGGRRP